LEVLEPRINNLRNTITNDPIRIMEIASGTGEHAALFAESLLNIIYQPTEPQINMHDSIISWTSKIAKGVVNTPVALDVSDKAYQSLLPEQFRENSVDAMICINMIHISPIECTDHLFRIASQSLQRNGFLLTYGPYRVNGSMVASNEDFDRNLKTRNTEWGIRDLETVREIANRHGMDLSETVSMPANNLCLVFRFKE
jgi:hypothetical protein